MKNTARGLFCCSLFLFSNNVFSLQQTGVTLGLVGYVSGSGNLAAGMTVTPNPNNCLWSSLYFENTKDYRAALGVALAAKVSGRTVRIDYEKNAEGRCLGWHIFVE